MGIKALNKFLKEKSPIAFQTIEIGTLSGYRVAIDACNWIYTYLSMVHKNFVMKLQDAVDGEIDREEVMKNCYKAFLDFLLVFLSSQITPIMVWDGQAHNAKSDTQAKRREEKRSRSEKIETLRAELRAEHELLRSADKIKEMQSLMCNTFNISYSEMDIFKGICKNLGIPSLDAESEAEWLCSYLCRSGKAVAAFSSDTDNIALGTPVMITNLNRDYKTGKINLDIVVVPYVRASLGFNEDEMRDFCILLGCDYNHNIKNYGPNKCYPKMVEHRNIEGVIKSIPAPSDCLNYELCRELLKPKEYSISEEDITINYEIFRDNGLDILESIGLSGYQPTFSVYLKIGEPKLVVFTEGN